MSYIQLEEDLTEVPILQQAHKAEAKAKAEAETEAWRIQEVLLQTWNKKPKTKTKIIFMPIFCFWIISIMIIIWFYSRIYSKKDETGIS